MLTRTLFVSLVVLTAACNHPGFVKTAEGTDDFKVADSVFVPLVVDGKVIGGDVILADTPNLCDSIRSGFLPSRMKSVTFRVFRFNETEFLAPDVDNYEVINTKPTDVGSYAFGELRESDLNCAQTLPPEDSVFGDGNVHIDRFETGDHGIVSGDFTSYRWASWLRFYSRKVEGRFNAQYCSAATQQFACR